MAPDNNFSNIPPYNKYHENSLKNADAISIFFDYCLSWFLILKILKSG